MWRTSRVDCKVPVMDTWIWFSGEDSAPEIEADKEIARILRQSPPRSIAPETMQKFLRGRSGGVRFNTILLYFFVVFLFICFFSQFPWALPFELLLEHGMGTETQTTLAGYEKTFLSIGGRRRGDVDGGREAYVYRVRFTFTDEIGARVSTHNYFTGLDGIPGLSAERDGQGERSPGSVSVVVRYLPFFSKMALLPGGRLNMGPRYWALTILSPLVALFLLRRHRRKIHAFGTLLREGIVAAGMVEIQAGYRRSRVYGNPFPGTKYQMSFVFRTPEGLTTAKMYVSGERAVFFRRCQKQGRAIPVVYLPNDTGVILPLAVFFHFL